MSSQAETKAVPPKPEPPKVDAPKAENPALSMNAKRTSLFLLYRFAGTKEKVLLALGVLSSLCVGVCGPLISILFGGAIGGFDPKTTHKTIVDTVSENCVLMVYLGIFIFFFSAFSQFTWTTAGEGLGVRVRTLYLKSIMKKDISWFDLNRPQELPTKISSLVAKYQGGIGEKVGKVVISMAMFIAGIIVAFIYGWQLALVLIGLSPITILAAVMVGVANMRGAEFSKRGYAKCGGYAEEALSAIRTVYAFCAEASEKNKYMKELGNALEASIKNGGILGSAVGLINFSMGLSHGFGYLIGSVFIQYKVYSYHNDKDYTCDTVMTVFFSALFAMFSLAMIAPQFKDIGEAQIAAYDIYEIIDSVTISEEDKGKKEKIPADKFKGRIEFHNVTFFYPTRPDVKVLDNFSMVFEEGKMVGICGETGSGKSTIIQLVERFYKPSSGKITVDGVDINDLDLKWWREMIGYVGQEPVLFNTSIKENIGYGKEGATQAEIEAAAAKANAAEFIQKLQTGYDTVTGSEGSKLSGGQKQRIAISRALMKQPRIMLLDEATSALDNTSERKVQEAFYKLQKEQGMTVLVIAHRLSTIKGADKIIVLHDGVLKEEGNDKELREKNSIYANLCRLQEGVMAEAANDDEIEGAEESPSRRKSSVGRKSSVHEEEQKKPEEVKIVVTKEEEEKKAAAIAALAKTYSSKLWEENMQHSLPLIFSIVLSCLSGGYMPIVGLLFGMVSMDLLEPDLDEMRRKVNYDFMGFVLDGAGMFLTCLGMIWMFSYVAANVTQRLRGRIYNHIFNMHIGWFDLPANIPSALNSTLSEGTDSINGVIRMTASVMIQSTTSLLIGLGLGFGFAWKIALIVLGCVPIMGTCMFFHMKFHAGFASKNEELYKDSMKILAEAVKNFRTVASFSSEEKVVRMYSESLAEPLAQSQYASIISGLILGVSQLMPYWVYAALFYFCALFLQKYGDNPRDTFVAVYSLLFAANAIGQAQQYAPDMGKAYAALFGIYGMLDQKSAITSPEKPTTNVIKGKIEFKDVSFKYPTRDDYVLQGFSAVIEAGQKVAMVGISGSGKSTIIQLLERFYDANSGQILIDGIDIKEYSLSDLRQAIGYVPQEPVLFDTTIEENVKYGNEKATRADVEDACRIADATDFITKNVDKGNKEIESKEVMLELDKQKEQGIDIGKGYERKVGAKGSLLSGGQKQRLAIARAVLKQPKIMLFDEATSALDSETEKIVQKALNQVSTGRTSIVIAHRLGTIDDNDTIFVLENGKMVESGTKKVLDDQKGRSE